MVNTYPDRVDNDTKIAEELRLIRCILEKFLAIKHSGIYVDYLLEHFGKAYISEK